VAAGGAGKVGEDKVLVRARALLALVEVKVRDADAATATMETVRVPDEDSGAAQRHHAV
jgi:hypothetical protein